MIATTHRISLAGNLQAWIPLHCGGGALSLPYSWLNCSFQINTGKQDLFSIQLHVSVKRLRTNADRQCLSLLSTLEKPERKETQHLKSASLLVAQTTRAHWWSWQLEDIALLRSPAYSKYNSACCGWGGVGFLHLYCQSVVKVVPIYLPRLDSFLLWSRTSSLSVLSSREEESCTHLRVYSMCYQFASVLRYRYIAYSFLS